MLWDGLLAPFAEFGFLRRALVGCLALSLSAPALGVFLMLRRMSLAGDALSHGILPGVALAFVLGGLWAPGLALGGLAAGLVIALGAGAIARGTGGREDAALAGLYLTALAAGVAIISWRGSAVELTQLLFGSVLGVDDAALLLMAGASPRRSTPWGCTASADGRCPPSRPGSSSGCCSPGCWCRTPR